MGDPSPEFIADVLSGRDRSACGRALRATTAMIEPFYSLAVRARNAGYASGVLRSDRLAVPTVSVGNITTGGTGKTPVVRWLVDRLRNAGRKPAVLLRGYRSNSAGLSDEQAVLERGLNTAGHPINIPVEANPSRVNGAAAVLQRQSAVDVFVLDDAFQHRKVHRDFDLVLVSATDPFGFDHLLPRGLLREPLSGLGRADAFLITRCSQANHEALRRIEIELARRQPAAPIYRANHVHTALLTPASNTRLPVDSLIGQRFFAFSGIGNPSALQRQLQSLAGEFVGHQWFADHHAYSNADILAVLASASAARASRVLTTEKDWVKIAELPALVASELPVSLLELGIQFEHDDDEQLLGRVSRVIERV